MDCRFSGKCRNRRMRGVFLLRIFSVSDTELEPIRTPLYGQSHHIYPLLRGLGPARQLSGSLRGASTKVTPILTSKQTHPSPSPKQRCSMPIMSVKTPSGTCMRVWVSGISIQCHAPWDPGRGPLEYISIALSLCITAPYHHSEIRPEYVTEHSSHSPG